MRLAAIAAAVSLSLLTLAHAQQAAAAIRTPVSIPAQPLELALRTLASQRSFQLIYHSDVVGSRTTSGAAGDLTLDEALTEILSGTGLTHRYLDDHTVTIVAPDSESSRNDTAVSRYAAEGGGGARAEAIQSDSHATDDGASSESSTPAARKNPTQLEEVVVTGSRLRRAGRESAQEVRAYSRQQIDRSGQTTVADFLNTLPEVSTSFAATPFKQNGETSVQLRGLPVGTTLVLVNGRRVESSGQPTSHPFFDLNNVPVAAVERIEVLPTGSSAIYGSDALAGVVNVILKKDLNGFSADTHYGSASGIDETSAGVAWGGKWDRGSLSIVGSYYTTGQLVGAERALTANQDHTQLGGADGRYTYCNPGTVYSSGTGNLPGLNASMAAIPVLGSGSPTVADFLSTSGQQNRCGYYSTYSIIPEAHRTGVLATGNYSILPGVELFAEMMYSHLEQSMVMNPVVLSKVVVPQANLFNPFGEAVRVDYSLPSPNVIEQHTDFSRPLLGLRGDIAGRWRWEIAAWQGKDHNRFDQTIYSVDQQALASALSSTDPASSVNLFATGVPASQSVLDSILVPAYQPSVGETQAANAYLSGPLLHLPSGDVEAVVGGEYNRDKLTASNSAAPTVASANYSFHRRIDSLFSELRVPLMQSATHPGYGDELALTSAFRYDDYDDFGSHMTSQYGLEWRPTGSLLLRAAYAEAFRAPALVTLYSPTRAYQTTVNDPLRGGAAVAVTALSGGNPDLGPETGISQSFGVVWSSESVAGLQSSLDYWKINQSKRVAYIGPQDIVNNADLFPGRIVRGPSSGGQVGEIQSLDVTSLNFGALHAAGVDFDVSYHTRVGDGELMPRISITEIHKYDAAITPAAPLVDRLGKANSDAFAPRWKGVLGLAWQMQAWSANLNARYVGSYLDYAPLVSGSEAGKYQTLGDFWLIDLAARWRIGSWLAPASRYLAKTYIEAGAVNLFDKAPQFSMYTGAPIGYDPSEADIRGRMAYLNLGVSW